MALNKILPFAQGGGANVQDDATFAADSALPTGNTAGVARSAFMNKLWRQSAAMAAGLAQFLADNGATDITDALAPATISSLLASASKSVAGMAAGTIVWVPSATPLSGTVKLNGAVFSRTTYSRLWSYASGSGNIAASDAAWAAGQFSPGDGVNTFRVPDARGYFLRAFDDGLGLDAGRVFASLQADQLPSHTHGVNETPHSHTANVSDPSHTHDAVSGIITTNSDVGSLIGSTGFIGGYNHGTNGNTPVFTGYSTNGITVGIVANATGITIQAAGTGSETRVKNIAWMPVIVF